MPFIGRSFSDNARYNCPNIQINSDIEGFLFIRRLAADAGSACLNFHSSSGEGIFFEGDEGIFQPQKRPAPTGHRP